MGATVYVVTQLIESNVVTPRLQANAVRLHPVVVMAILVIAADIFGIWGMIVGVPLAAAGRDVFVYFQEQWRQNSEREEQTAEIAGGTESSDVNIEHWTPESTTDTA